MYVHTRRARRAKRQAPRCPPSLRAASQKSPFGRTGFVIDGGPSGTPVFRFAKKPKAPSQARSPKMLKTCHWHVFALTGRIFTLMGSSSPTVRCCTVFCKRKTTFAGGLNSHGGPSGTPVFRSAKKPNPPSQARSGETLKTCHRHVFLTRFHLIGSSPRLGFLT